MMLRQYQSRPIPSLVTFVIRGVVTIVIPSVVTIVIRGVVTIVFPSVVTIVIPSVVTIVIPSVVEGLTMGTLWVTMGHTQNLQQKIQNPPQQTVPNKKRPQWNAPYQHRKYIKTTGHPTQP